MRLLLAPAVWLAHFTVAYVLVSLVCSVHVADRALFGVITVPLGVGLATAAALALFALTALVDYRRSRSLEGTARFVALTSVLLCSVSAVAVLWVAYPAFVVPPCVA